MLRGSSLIWVHIVCNISYTRALADNKRLNNGSFEKKLNYANCTIVILIYVCFVKQMCKLSTKLGGSRTATPSIMNIHLFLCINNLR